LAEAVARIEARRRRENVEFLVEIHSNDTMTR
jgi:hypothetical protein